MVYKQALEQADRNVADTAKIRMQANHELAAATAINAKAKEKYKQEVTEYIEERLEQVMDAANITLLQKLIQKHLAQHETPETIAAWLDVPKKFVTTLKVKIDRAKQYQPKNVRMQLSGNLKLQFADQGRGGTIYFISDETKFSLWWEFAGNDAIAFIEAPSADRWTKHTGLPLKQRNDVLIYIGEQVIAKCCQPVAIV